MNESIWFQVNVDDRGDVVIEWDVASDDEEEEDVYGIPGPEGIAFLRQELSRLQAVEKEYLQEKSEDIAQYQWDTIMSYYRASTLALSKAIESAEAYLDNEL